jgi:hypothetical protein
MPYTGCKQKVLIIKDLTYLLQEQGKKKVENCWYQLRGSSKGSKSASGRAFGAKKSVLNAGAGSGW